MGSLAESDAPPSAPRTSNVRNKVGVLVAVFGTLLVVQIGLTSMFMESAWRLSAYERGLVEWTARRQAAGDALVDSLSGRRGDARERFEEAMRGLEAFEEARGALFGEPGREPEATEDLVRGGLRADEAAAIVHLTQSVPTFPRSRALYEAWQDADRAVDRLESIGASVFTKAEEDALSDGRARELTRTIRGLEEELERIEGRFGRQLAASREILRNRLRLEQITGSAILVLLAVGAGIWTARRLDRDAEERRIAEEERERLTERLRLSQKLEAVGRLAGGVAHDFNNLLTAILGYCDLLEAKLGGREEGMGEVREIRRAGERAGTLTRQLLAFSRKQVIDPRVLDLDRVIERSARMIRRLIPESIELEWRLESGPARILADSNQIEQLLMNLSINARDALASGGRLTISTRRERLETARRGDLFEVVPGDYVRLRVADTGGGMDAEIMEHAFEPFYTTKPSGEGTGLGLATVYGIVKQNQGYIWVDSEPGRGTAFSIYFPSVAAEDEDAEETRESESPDRAPAAGETRNETVLLVEDEEAVRHLVREILSRRGYTVIEARDARHARAAVRDRMAEVDLLVTDLVMPGMSGEDLARTLLDEKPELPVVYITGYSEGMLNAGELFGEGSYLLLKPFTAEQLIATVRDALDPDVREQRARGARP